MKKKLVVLSVLLNLLMVLILFTPLSSILYGSLIIDHVPERSDVIVVLSGNPHKNGTPGFRGMTRVMKALELYRAGYAPKIICLGGTVKGMEISSAQALKRMLRMFGVQEDDIIVQDRTLNTYNDISSLLDDFRDRYNFDNSIFVTSSYHTYRVKKVLEKKGFSPYIVSAGSYEDDPLDWAERLSLFREVAREYGAICYFKLMNWI